MLDAVGARPAIMSRVTAIKAFAVTITGSAIAIPAGFLPVVVVRWASGGGTDYNGTPIPQKPFHFPWLIAAVLVVAIPIIVSLVSWAGSALARKFGRANQTVTARLA